MITEPAPSPTEHPTPLANRYVLFAISVGAATVLAIAVGGLVGWSVLTAEQNSCSPQDGWCDLGAALVGILFGGFAGIVTYVVAGVTIIIKCRPQGNRAGHLVALLGFPPVTVLVLTAIGSAIP